MLSPETAFVGVAKSESHKYYDMVYAKYQTKKYKQEVQMVHGSDYGGVYEEEPVVDEPLMRKALPYPSF